MREANDLQREFRSVAAEEARSADADAEDLGGSIGRLKRASTKAKDDSDEDFLRMDEKLQKGEKKVDSKIAGFSSKSTADLS